MKFWKFSTLALATLLSVVSLTSALGPADGDAVADPNSAVVKLTTETFKNFMEENPLVLAEFFAPWCGYCKLLAPEFVKAADGLNETHPNIKLAQIDCTEEEQLCGEFGIRGYPTLKVFRGESNEDYAGPREASGISEYMIKQSLPSVQQPATIEELTTIIEGEKKPFVIGVNAPADSIFESVASTLRNDYDFISVSDKAIVKALDKKLTNVNLGKKTTYLLVHPDQFDDVRELSGDLSKEDLYAFVQAESIPYFGDINRETYMSYMSSPLPLAYYFYNNQEERDAIAADLSTLGKKYKGKINFVGLDATFFGKHAEVINMNPEIIPLFAIQDIQSNKKYGIDQTEHPEGPNFATIEKFVQDFVAGNLTPITKSEPLPTKEEQEANPVVKLVAHNHQEILEDVSKDIFVKYYAPWCGHCKKLAPVWEELGEIFHSNSGKSEVIIADIDHTANDVAVPVDIEGYPTLLLYPANGELDEKTGLRKPIVFSGVRDLDSLVEFIKTEGALKVDGNVLKNQEDDDVEEEDEEEKEESVEHDEL
jgi:protein disulfide-isomerase A1